MWSAVTSGLGLAGVGGAAFLGSSSASQAADAQVEAAELNAQLARDIFGAQQALQQPYLDAGAGAMDYAAAMMGLPTGSTAPTDDIAGYLAANPDVADAGATLSGRDREHVLRAGYDTNFDGRVSPEEFGLYHYDRHGRGEGRAMPTTTPQVSQTAAAYQDDPLAALMAHPGVRASYDAYFDEGQEAVQQALAYGGMTGSGSAVRQLADYGGQFALQQYNNTLAQMLGVASQGSTAAARTSGSLSAMGSNVSGANTQRAGASSRGLMDSTSPYAYLLGYGGQQLMGAMGNRSGGAGRSSYEQRPAMPAGYGYGFG